MSPKEALELYSEILSTTSKAVITKLANVSAYHLEKPTESAEMSTFGVETALFGVPFEGFVDLEAEIESYRVKKHTWRSSQGRTCQTK